MVVDEHKRGLFRRNLPHSVCVDMNAHEDHANKSGLLHNEFGEFAGFFRFFVPEHRANEKQKEDINRKQPPEEGKRKDDPSPKVDQALIPPVKPKQNALQSKGEQQQNNRDNHRKNIRGTFFLDKTFPFVDYFLVINEFI